MDIFRGNFRLQAYPVLFEFNDRKKFDLILEAIPNWIPADMGYLNFLYDKYKPKTATTFKKDY